MRRSLLWAPRVRFRFHARVFLGALAALLGCHPSSSSPPAASPDARPLSPRDDAPSPSPANASLSLPATLPPWPVPLLSGSMVAVSEPFPSLGHGAGRFTTVIWASGRNVYPDGSVPVGFVVCADHRASSSLGESLACARKVAKQAGDRSAWQFAIARRGATAWDRVGALPDCVGCHRTAPHDHLFGPPLS